MQAAGPAVASSATRPELSRVAVGDYTIRKALAQGYVINGHGARRRRGP